jgi:hypothetical protein
LRLGNLIIKDFLYIGSKYWEKSIDEIIYCPQDNFNSKFSALEIGIQNIRVKENKEQIFFKTNLLQNCSFSASKAVWMSSFRLFLKTS